MGDGNIAGEIPLLSSFLYLLGWAERVRRCFDPVVTVYITLYVTCVLFIMIFSLCFLFLYESMYPSMYIVVQCWQK